MGRVRLDFQNPSHQSFRNNHGHVFLKIVAASFVQKNDFFPRGYILSDHPDTNGARGKRQAEIEKLLKPLVLPVHFTKTDELPLKLLNACEVFLLLSDCIQKISGLVADRIEAVPETTSENDRRPG